MKVRLIHSRHDFTDSEPLAKHATTLRQDLAVDTIVAAMADNDQRITDTALKVLIDSLDSPASDALWRQTATRDAVANPDIIRSLYQIAGDALEDKRKNYWGIPSQHPSWILYSALRVMGLFVDRLQALHEVADKHAQTFESEAFSNLFAMLQRELDDAYRARVKAYLKELRFDHGVQVSVDLGPDCESTDFMLRRSRDADANWLTRLIHDHTSSRYTVRVAPRDLAGAKTVADMRDRGIKNVADAVSQSAEHIAGFFTQLHTELAFYVGCVNLHERLEKIGTATCFPDLLTDADSVGFKAGNLCDPALALTTEHAVVGNDMDATGKGLIIVTGANQGGKSTFLRSLGLAQMMAQAGLFVAAQQFATTPCTGLFTHYKREEDADMEQGKLDEELARLGDIADAIRPGAWLLSNESFASTNEREGSELGRQMLAAMHERHIQVAFVTHLYALAHALAQESRKDILFLRAQRKEDGTRTFRLESGAPRATSYGEDLYREVFGSSEDDSATATDHSDAEQPETAIRDGTQTA